MEHAFLNYVSNIISHQTISVHSCETLLQIKDHLFVFLLANKHNTKHYRFWYGRKHGNTTERQLLFDVTQITNAISEFLERDVGVLNRDL